MFSKKQLYNSKLTLLILKSSTNKSDYFLIILKFMKIKNSNTIYSIVSLPNNILRLRFLGFVRDIKMKRSRFNA